jgi:hypothetical protein
MRCAACGQENRDTAKFRRGCGQRFDVTRPRCDAGLPAGARQALLAHGRVLHALERQDDAVATWREVLDRLAVVDHALPGGVRSALRQSPVSPTLHELVA